MASKRKPLRRPKGDIKAAADRAEARAKGKPIEKPKIAIDPVIDTSASEAEKAEMLATPVIHKVRTGAGRPTGYKPEYCQIVADLTVNGCTDHELGEELNVDARTIYRWKAAHPEFRQAWLAAKELREQSQNDRVERSLYHRAVGYTYDAIKILQYEGQPVIVAHKEHLPPDVGAIKTWLTNRDEKRWSEKTRSEVSGPGGGPILLADVSKLELARWIALQLTQAQALTVE